MLQTIIATFTEEKHLQPLPLFAYAKENEFKFDKNVRFNAKRMYCTVHPVIVNFVPVLLFAFRVNTVCYNDRKTIWQQRNKEQPHRSLEVTTFLDRCWIAYVLKQQQRELINNTGMYCTSFLVQRRRQNFPVFKKYLRYASSVHKHSVL